MTKETMLTHLNLAYDGTDMTLMLFNFTHDDGDDPVVYTVVASQNGKVLSRDVQQSISDALSSYIEDVKGGEIDIAKEEDTKGLIETVLNSFRDDGVEFYIPEDVCEYWI